MKRSSTVLEEARNIGHSLDGLRARVKGIQEGIECEVHVVLDVMLPQNRIIDAIQAFREEFPSIMLHVRVEALGAVMQAMLDKQAIIGVCGPPDTPIDGIERVEIGHVTLIPVSSPEHPLARTAKNKSGAGREHMQVVLTDRSSRTAGTDLGVHATKTWRVTDLATKHMLLLEGIGWGNMPEPLVRKDIQAGRLVHLKIPDCKGGPYRMFAIHRTDTPPGPAASFLIARFASQLVEGP